MSGPTKGMVAGQPIQTGIVTKEYEEGYERTFGAPSGKRGRWIWDPVSKKLVTPEEYRPASRAIDAPIMVDRHYEGLSSPIDGSDIGSRRKRREHMKRHGVVDAEDYRGTWKKAAEERAAYSEGRHAATKKDIREALGRAWYQHTGY